ncbi:MAG: hypothetical protein ACYC1T_04325 [Sulfuricaulis sp.]
MSMYLRPYFRGFVATFCLTTLAISSKGMAAEWTAQPAVTARHEYNDNINLSVHPHKSVRGSFITPSLDLGVNTPTWLLNGGVSATQRRYSGQAGLDRDDSASRLSTLYRTERNIWQLSASRSQSSLLSGDLITSDTGIVQTQRQTLTESVTPSWTWMYSERTQLQVLYQLSDVSYGNSQSVGLYDYDYRSATATLSNQLSELNRVFVIGGYSTFSVPTTGFDSDTRSLQVGASRNFSSTTQGTLQAGLRNSDSFTRGGNPVFTRFSTVINGEIEDVLIQTGVTQDSRRETTSSVFSGSLERKFERAFARLAVNRALIPSGSGGQTEQDSVSINLTDPVSPRLMLSVNANWQKTRAFEGNIANSDLTYYNFSSGIDWQWSRDWSVGMDYRYAHVNREHETAAADSNSVGLTLIYRPLKMSISR